MVANPIAPARRRWRILAAMTSPTGLITDEAPTWSIIDASRPITDLPLIGGEDDWRRGVEAWWRTAQVTRQPIHGVLDSVTDASIANVADPAVWPDHPVVIETSPAAGDQLATFPIGVKTDQADPNLTIFRPMRVYAPAVLVELYQGTGPDVGQAEPNEQARRHLEAHIGSAIVAEFADSLTTKNPGLYRTAVDQSAGGGATAVDMSVAVATLYEAHGRLPDADPTADELSLSGGSGDARLTVPYHALPGLVERSLATWDRARNAYLDPYGNPIITAPGYVGRGPLTVNDPDVAVDLETSQAPASGEGWFYISHAPFVGVGRFWARVEGEGDGAPPGADPHSNLSLGLAEAAAIVVFRPERVFAVRTIINEVP